MEGINQEIRNRILLSVAAWAYEFKDDPIMSDDQFDSLAKSINPNEKTGNRKLDNFFKKHFETDTGMWIHKHPERRKLAHIYETYYRGEKK